MKDQNNHYPIKHMIHLLHLLQMNHIEIEPLLTGTEQTDLLSPEEYNFCRPYAASWMRCPQAS